jgi:ABC-2 type transport system ATP-binding protein
MTGIAFPRTTTAKARRADDSCMFIIVALVVLGGLGFMAVRFVRPRLTTARTQQLSHLSRRQSPPLHEPEPAARPDGHPHASQPARRPAGGWAVETRGLAKTFGTRAAVDHVDLLVPLGSAFGYLGPNGAGKTTLIRVLLGLTRADSGTMSLLGIPVPGQRGRALARVGAIVDEPRFHGHLTGRENLKILAAARGGGAADQIAPALDRTGLTQRADDKVSAYSMGMRQRLGLAACLLADPQLLILDEPMNGLDPAGMHEMRDMVRGLVDEGRTVVLSSHLLDEVERTCDAVAIVDHGQLIRQGPIEELTGAGGAAVEVQCSDPSAAACALGQGTVASRVAVSEDGVTVTLAPGRVREQTAEICRRLVEAGISVYSLRQTHASLEDWFLSVTSRFGGEQ